MIGQRAPVATLAVVTYVVGGSVATIQAFRADPDVTAGIAFFLVALALLFLAAFAVGSWSSLGLPFVPVIPVAVWDEATCHDDFIDFCGLAPIAMLLLAVLVGIPAVVFGTAISPRFRRNRKRS